MEMQDIEEQLKIQEERCQLLMLCTHTMTYDYDVNKDELSFVIRKEDNTYEIRHIEEYMSQIVNSDLLEPTFIPEYMECLTKAIRQYTKGKYEFRANFLGKGYRWYCAHYVSICGENGKVYHVVGRAEDIEDERVAQERKCAEAENRDKKTGFYNYENGKRLAEEYLARNMHINIGMLVFQIDGLEELASHDGYQVEEAVLLNIVEAIKRNVPKDVLLIRTGSTQFMIFGHADNVDEVKKSREQIINEIEGMYINKPGDLPIRVTAAMTDNSTGNNFSEMYHICKIQLGKAVEKRVSTVELNEQMENQEMRALIYEIIDLATEAKQNTDEKRKMQEYLSMIEERARTLLNITKL